MSDTNAHISGTQAVLNSSIRQVLQRYYGDIEKRTEWHNLLSDDFLLTGGPGRDTRGKDAYVNLGFWKLVRSLRVKDLIVEGEQAFALVSYDLISPKGTPFTTDVAEFWTAKHGRLDSLAIYFDTAAFNNYMSR